MTRRRDRDHGRYRVIPQLDGFAALSASYLDHVFVPHSHPWYVVGTMATGSAVVRCGDRSEVIGHRDVLCINVGAVHSARALTADGWHYVAFHATPALVRSVLGAEREKYFGNLRIADAGFARRLRSAIQTILESHDPGQAKAMGEQVVIEAWRHATECPASDDHPPRADAVEQVRQLIDHAEDPVISVGTLAAQAGISRYHLIRTFARRFGLTPYAYHLQRRVDRARALLQQGEPASIVAVRCGFSDQSHLIRHFKRLVGVTPGEFGVTPLSPRDPLHHGNRAAYRAGPG